MANKDQPLKVEVVGGLLTISVGVSALCTTLKNGPAFEVAGEHIPEITDEDAFVREVARQLEMPVTRNNLTALRILFDDAAEEAVAGGAEGLRLPGAP